jgi:hypothetical protein
VSKAGPSASSEALSWHQRTGCQNNNLLRPNMALDDYRRNQDSDVRLVDFLDDKLQAFADFDSLDSLLDSVKAQQDLLKQQVRERRQCIVSVASSDHLHSLLMPITTMTSPNKPRTSMPLQSNRKALPSSATNRTSTAVSRLSLSQRPATMPCKNSSPVWHI